MNAKKNVKFFISIGAILVAVTHLIFPKVQIDIITVVLIAIAIIPWLEPLFKSVELPGGVKFEFQELEKIKEEAKKIGLISAEEESKIIVGNDEKYYFVEIAEKNQGLALVSLRIEIEKSLREIATKYSIDTKKYSIIRLIDALAHKNILTIEETTVLKDMISTLNHAAHGGEYDQRTANWVIENGPVILDSLENRIAKRGIIFHGAGYDKEHWIDKSFNESECHTNSEMNECISKHLDLWNNELENIYNSLLQKIDTDQKEKLIQSQNNWKKQISLDQKFIYSFDDLKIKVGLEGQMLSSAHFMNKVRERTLELEEILTSLT
ncbi:lysozyme inhibitor LprI family protein [Chryseobacterium schmidteae]|uniref:lysozyme inhibitor LprI family protein n=1 Tax=Chryseobacterium schmidteae TaxID=2730404 RepID=UPI00158C700D|nr:lysozyme inhibitor LprI family protein [Chryseobacterium schmidteae]